MQNPLVVSVILNSNKREETLQCLGSICNNSYVNQKVVLLDNGSTDGSVEAIRSSFPEVKIINLDVNLGYAGNNNIGIKAAMDMGAEWVFVLNEDTVLASDCIAQLIIVAESDPSIGIVGPMVYHYDDPSTIQSAGGMFDQYLRIYHLGQNQPDKGQYIQPHVVKWISGCGILVRTETIRQIGMLDARFFYYFEEFEWCFRAIKAGWKIVHIPQAKLWHKGVQQVYQPKPTITYYATRNRLFVLAKHHASMIVWIITWLDLFRSLASWTIKPKWRWKHDHRNAMWRGILDFLGHRWGQMA